MITLCFSLFDTKASIFNTPFFFPSRGQAVRACVDLAADSQNLIGRHPGDFVLYELGSFDDQKGQFSSVIPDHVGSVLAFLEKRPVQLPLLDKEAS